MRISIIVPTQLNKYKYPARLSMSGFPVGLAYLAGALKAAGHEVFGCNPNNLYDFPSAKVMAGHDHAAFRRVQARGCLRRWNLH
jgi:hypothetical protein